MPEVTLLPKGKLENHQGDPEQKNGDKVRDKKRAATILTDDVRELPYIAPSPNADPIPASKKPIPDPHFSLVGISPRSLS